MAISIKTLEQKHQTFSKEYFSIPMPQFQENLGSRFLMTVTDTMSAMTDYASNMVRDMNTSFIPDYKLNTELNRTEYMVLKDTVLECPPGLNVSFLSYASVLIRASQWAEDTVIPTLSSVEKYINRAAGVQDFFANGISDPFSHRIEEIRKQDKTIREQIAKCYDTKSHVSTTTFGKAFDRTSDWAELSEQLSELKDLQTKLKLKQIHDQVKRIVTSSEYLSGNYNDTETAVRNDKKTLEVANILYVAASLVEFAGSLSYMNKTFIEVCDRNKEKLRKLL